MPARTCSRCRGIADPGAQFCKFCGASLPGAVASAGKPDGGRPNGAKPKNPHEETIVTGPPNNMGGGEPLRAAAAPAQAAPRPAPAPSVSPIGPAGAAFAAAAPAAFPRPGSVVPPQAAPSMQQPAASRPPPAPAGMAATMRGRLVVIAKSGADGPSYPFGDLLDIGRSEGGVVVAEDPYLSPRHVRVVWQAGKMILRDLASTNGVYLRLSPSRDIGMRRSAEGEITVALNDGDLVLVGQQVLRFDVLKEGEGGFGPAQEHGTLVFGSPAAPRYARLCQRTVEGIARDIYYIRKLETVLGRESGDVVFTEDPFLSRRHAAIRMLAREGGGPGAGARPPTSSDAARFVLVDLGSSNGTFLRIRGDVELAPGDHFRVGQQLFRVDFDGPRGVGE
jgi:pSer/pThr/pTyr-binding forkhead associated (FHA) protein